MVMESVLSALPWMPVNVGGCDLLAKAWFGDTQYRVLLSDLNGVWEEDMNADDIQSRAQARIIPHATPASAGVFECSKLKAFNPVQCM